MIVDAHHHIWDPSRADYPWLTDELAVIRRPFTPTDLEPLLAAGLVPDVATVIGIVTLAGFTAGIAANTGHTLLTQETEAGREANRRIEFTLIGEEAAAVAAGFIGPPLPPPWDDAAQPMQDAPDAPPLRPDDLAEGVASEAEDGEESGG